MARDWTQLLTEMSTGDPPWMVKSASAQDWQPCNFYVPIVWKSWSPETYLGLYRSRFNFTFTTTSTTNTSTFINNNNNNNNNISSACSSLISCHKFRLLGYKLDDREIPDLRRYLPLFLYPSQNIQMVYVAHPVVIHSYLSGTKTARASSWLISILCRG
jgi:hypothetical protein